jgi:antimicrobial peptide system SdpB family protein
MAPAWRGSAYAGHLLLRCQIVIIYLDASLSKLEFHGWRSGIAVPVLLNNPQFGLPPGIRQTVEGWLGPAWIGAAVTWAVIAIEITIAVTMLFGVRVRRVGLALAVCLHSAIVIVMGLFSFGLIMISLVMVVCDGQVQRQSSRAWLHRRSGHRDTQDPIPSQGPVLSPLLSGSIHDGC